MKTPQLTQLTEMVHDLAGPITALTLTMPEIEKAVRAQQVPQKTKLYVDLCQSAIVDIQQKLKKLHQFAEIAQIKQ
jgi:hypothetical protein